MKSFNYYLSKAGHDPLSKPPAIVYTYAAYKNGTAAIFPTELLALGYSKNIETVFTTDSKAAVDEFWANRGRLESKAVTLWIDDLNREYSHLPSEVFDLCFDEAYDTSHSSGHDEVAAAMESMVYFAEKIMKASK